MSGGAEALDFREQIENFRADLLAWYDGQKRALPWRERRDAYGIWLSEIMLQQTTVAAVVPRWRRFLERFPSLDALARAPRDEVLAEWSGLGYYARARNLHAAAKAIATDHGGEFPRDYAALKALPGMGAYTAAAVASIAFGEAVAAVDANVERVVARVLAEEGDVKKAAAKRRLADVAGAMLAPERASDWNQAMMELGATVCLAREAKCGACPIAPWCGARASGEPERFPVKRRKPPMREVDEVAVVLRRMDKVLVLRRAPAGSFAGMWELPRGEVLPGETIPEAAERLVRGLTGLCARPRSAFLRLKHAVMRNKITLHVLSADYDMGRIALSPAHDAQEWVLADDWAQRPVSTTQKDVALFLAEGRLPRRPGGRGTTGESGELFGGDALL